MNTKKNSTLLLSVCIGHQSNTHPPPSTSQKRIIVGLSGSLHVSVGDLKPIVDAQNIMHFGFQSARQVHHERSRLAHITTGSTHLDALLGGGIEAGSITEIVAESNSGKLELCHTLAVTCQLPVYMGGGGTGCLYIDAEDTFQPQRLISIADRYRLNRQDVLDNVGYVKALNLGVDQQTSLLTTAVALMCEKRYSVLIIDSWTALFRSFYSAPYMLPAHKSHITMFSRVLQRLAAEYEIAVVVTNQVTSNPQPVGGNIISHVVSTTELRLQKAHGNTCTCHIYKSPCLPNNRSLFAIFADGVGDPKEA